MRETGVYADDQDQTEPKLSWAEQASEEESFARLLVYVYAVMTLYPKEREWNVKFWYYVEPSPALRIVHPTIDGAADSPDRHNTAKKKKKKKKKDRVCLVSWAVLNAAGILRIDAKI